MMSPSDCQQAAEGDALELQPVDTVRAGTWFHTEQASMISRTDSLLSVPSKASVETAYFSDSLTSAHRYGDPESREPNKQEHLADTDVVASWSTWSAVAGSAALTVPLNNMDHMLTATEKDVHRNLVESVYSSENQVRSTVLNFIFITYWFCSAYNLSHFVAIFSVLLPMYFHMF